MSTYNGWTNRETWLIGLHFEFKNKKDLEYIQEMLYEEEEKLPAFFRDFIDLSLINWREIEETFHLEDGEEEED